MTPLLHAFPVSTSKAAAMDYITEPVWSSKPFSKRMPTHPEMLKFKGKPPCCCKCLHEDRFPDPFCRGIPHDSVPLPEEETQELLRNLEGSWKIVPPEGSAPGIMYTTARVQDDHYTLSGGTRLTFGGEEPNPPCTEHFHFYRGPEKEIYLDYIGTVFTKTDFHNGRVEFNNGLNIPVVWQREENNSSSPQQQNMETADNVTAVPVVVQATVVVVS